MNKNQSKSKLSMLVGILVSSGGAIFVAQQAHAFGLTINDSNGSVVCSAGSMSVDTAGNVIVNSGSGCLAASTSSTTTTTTGGSSTSTSSTSTTGTTTSTTTTTAAPSPTSPPTLTCSDSISGKVDRGCQTWMPDDTSISVFTANRTTQRNYIPGCIAGPDSGFFGCYNKGSALPGEMYALRIMFRGGKNSRYAMNLVNAAGIAAEFAAFDAAISLTPGSKMPLDNDVACATDAAANRNGLYVADAKTVKPFYKFSSCKMKANEVYYLNIWPSDNVVVNGNSAKDCGRPGVDCRVMLENGLFSLPAADSDPFKSDLMPNFY